MDLGGAVVVVTGASRGLGALIAEHFAARGTDLVLAARSAGGLEETAARVRALGRRAVCVPTDVMDAGERQMLVERAVDEMGKIDVLVNNAGIERYERFEREDPATIDAIVTTNLIAPLQLARLVLPGMIERRRGHIVNMASAAGKTAVPYNSTYGATKHALVGFSWSLREEMRPHGIGVSVVCPGFVTETGMAASWLEGRRVPKVAGAIPPGRVAEATVRVVERNRAEAVVSAGLGKIADVSMAISPDFSMSVARRAGLYKLLRSGADRK
ncbi:MAG TPA: SDR family NAD(P)-dependent oxidoreductase [Actinomycetota bacterium]|jgi:uncharacterized protein|nr:SDR family NAD(P)-dependent oxidoreductase [Actinomycetota bacterium]